MTHLGAFPVSFQRSSFLCVYVGGFNFFQKNKTKQNIVVHRIFVLLVSRLRFYVVGISKETALNHCCRLGLGLGLRKPCVLSRTGEQSYLGPACLINNAGPELHF